MRKSLTNVIIADLSLTRPCHVLFSSLLQHDIDTHFINEDFHSTQLINEGDRERVHQHATSALCSGIHGRCCQARCSWKTATNEQITVVQWLVDYEILLKKQMECF